MTSLAHMPQNQYPTYRWDRLSPLLRREARDRLSEELVHQGATTAEAAVTAALLAGGIDLSLLALSTRDTARTMSVSHWRTMVLRHEGRMPTFVELFAVGEDGQRYCHTRAFWRCIAEAWGEHKAAHPYHAGRGRRWEP